MYITQLLYCSKATHEISAQQISTILAVSRNNNRSLKITGLLCHNEQYFIQLLEGHYREVNNLYNKIANDSRHHQVTLLIYQSAKTRLFPDWSMAYVDEAHYINDLLRKYIDRKGLIEIELFGKASLNFMQDYAKS